MPCSIHSAGVISKPTPISQGVGFEKKGVGYELTPRSKCRERKHFRPLKIRKSHNRPLFSVEYLITDPLTQKFS
jgi:hypothetical protein